MDRRIGREGLRAASMDFIPKVKVYEVSGKGLGDEEMCGCAIGFGKRLSTFKLNEEVSSG